MFICPLKTFHLSIRNHNEPYTPLKGAAILDLPKMADLVVVLVFRVILTQIFTFNIFEEKYNFFFQNVLSIDRTFLTIFFKELIFSLVSMLKPFFAKF